MKRCCVCKLIKNSSDFHKGKAKDSLSYYCKPCDKDRGRAYRAKNRVRETARHKKYRNDHPDYKRARNFMKSTAKRCGLSCTITWCRAMINALWPFCIGCGETEDLQIDHILPIRTHPELGFTLTNLQRLCVPCHKAKTKAESCE